MAHFSFILIMRTSLHPMYDLRILTRMDKMSFNVTN